jgi:hypothetical protein
MLGEVFAASEAEFAMTNPARPLSFSAEENN